MLLEPALKLLERSYFRTYPELYFESDVFLQEYHAYPLDSELSGYFSREVFNYVLSIFRCIGWIFQTVFKFILKSLSVRISYFSSNAFRREVVLSKNSPTIITLWGEGLRPRGPSLPPLDNIYLTVRNL